MQTILLFGGKASGPLGGTRDFLGTLPFISADVIMRSVLEIARQTDDKLEAEYWANVLVVSETGPRETRDWLIKVGSDTPSFPEDYVVEAKTSSGEPYLACIAAKAT